jgi:hypothetical protein
MELIDGDPVRFRQPGDIGKPSRGTGELRTGIIETLRRHGEQCRLVRGRQVCPRHKAVQPS